MRIEENISLASYNTFGIDVRARYYAEYATEEELARLLSLFAGKRILPLGSGSNVLFTGDFAGLVLRSRLCRARTIHESGNDIRIEAESGLIMDELIEQLADMEIGGLENLSSIPGTVGAAVVQNIGAYGVEIKDVVDCVYAMDVHTGKIHVFKLDDCRYGYRCSLFNTSASGQYIVTKAVFRLKRQPIFKLDYSGLAERVSGDPTCRKVREAVMEIRRNKLPDLREMGSAGSFFKNPVIPVDCFAELIKRYPNMPSYEVCGRTGEPEYKLSAAWLIDACGLKGTREGDAQVYEKQPLVIVNTGRATAADVMRLAEKVQTAVRQKFGITLTPEAVYV